MDHYGSSSCQLHQLEGQDETAGYVKKIPRSMPGRYDYSEVEKDLYRCGFSVLQSYAAICRNAHDAAGSAVCDNASLQKSRKCIQVPQISATCIWTHLVQSKCCQKWLLKRFAQVGGKMQVFFDLKWLRRFQMVLKWGIIAESHSLHHSL